MGLPKQVAGFFRGLRPTYWLHNLMHYKRLKANRQLYKQTGINKPVWYSLKHADIKRTLNEKPWLDEPDAVIKMQQSKVWSSFPTHIQQALLPWPQDGYVILKNYFTAAETEAVNNSIDDLLQTQKAYLTSGGRKIMNAWRQSRPCESLFKQKQLLTILSFLLGKQVVPFQTINFVYGSEQRAHSDSVHMTTEPLGYLIATWTALEDVQEGSGILEYYPGSHKLPYVLSEDYETNNTLWSLGADNYPNYEKKIASVIATHHLTPQYFKAQKGDVLIWHANLLHGGSPITQKELTRKSQVAHYFGKGVLCYHEISQRPALL
jgi:hypothetical protein